MFLGLFSFNRISMKYLAIVFTLFFVGTAFGQSIKPLDKEALNALDFETVTPVNVSSADELVIESKTNVLFDFSTTDFPIGEVDSVVVAFGPDTITYEALTPYLAHGMDESKGFEVTAYRGGDAIKFGAQGTESLKVSIKRKDRPFFVNDTVVFGVLAIVLALIFYTAHIDHAGWKKFYTWVPALLLCYLIPALLDTMGLISNEYTGLYKMAKNYLLPGALILMTIGIDFKGIVNLGPKALIMFFTATIGIIIGGPIAIWVFSMIDPEVVGGSGSEAAWRGFSTLAGSWIGGGANQTAMYELYGYKQALYGKMITVDIVVAQLWMIFLLWGAARAHKFDKWLKADTKAIDDLKNRMSDYESQHSKKPTLTDYMVIAGLTFGIVGASHFASYYFAPFFEEMMGSESPLASKFFWLVVLTTLGGIILSITRAKKYEGSGASKIGSFFIYILVATIGMKMDLGKALEEPMLIVVGLIWMGIHVGLLFLVAKLIKAPFFFLAVGSKANVGGAASAPVVAAAFHPSLASVGALLAVLGYGIGSIGAIFCAELMSMVAP
jgi:uncharacterized membrane protein